MNLLQLFKKLGPQTNLVVLFKDEESRPGELSQVALIVYLLCAYLTSLVCQALRVCQ